MKILLDEAILEKNVLRDAQRLRQSLRPETRFFASAAVGPSLTVR